MKKKFNILWVFIQIIVVIIVFKYLWELWLTKGDFNLPLGLLGMAIIVIFYLPYLVKQIKNLKTN